MYEDKTLTCKECGQEFVFTAGEQEFYAEKGFENEPQRCKSCRAARKAAGKAARPTVEVVCTRCGATCNVPESVANKPDVLCSSCLDKKNRGED